jgi:glycosyltransferase involved in cell wall biosynthesis
LDLALAQTEPDLEVVVLDDASTDGTFEIAAARNDPRLRVIKGERNLGLAGNFNRAMDAGRGEYIKLFCDDDFLYPEAVARLADALDRFPDAPFATSAWNLLDENGALRATMRLLKNAPADGTLVGLREVVRSSLLWRNRIGSPSSVLLRRSALDGLRFNSQYRQMMDWDVWLQLLKRGPIAYLPLVLTAYQWHAETLSAKQQSDAQTASDLLALSRVYDDSLDTFGGAMTRWDVKRLQFLCFLNAIEVAVLNVVCLRWRSVGRNLRLAWRALSASLS